MKKRKMNNHRSFDDRIDEVMRSIGLRMIEDFRASSDSKLLFVRQYEALKKGDIKAFREVKYNLLNAPVYLMKQGYQLENLYKRHIFQKDMYTQEELKDKSQRDFVDFQKELASTQFVFPLRTTLVLQRARTLVGRILSKVDFESVFDKGCEFGRRANYGVPYIESYLDKKVEVLSGSPAHRALWNEVSAKDDLLTEIMKLRGQRPASHDSICHALKLTSVPKSFKAFRTICPNTVLGAFFTASLGTLIQEALKIEGLDIQRLQNRHGRYAQKSSIQCYKSNGHLGYVTADMSKASDSFSAQLVNRLVPRKWYNALKLGRIGQVEVDGRQYYMASFMAMGIGYTFALETLLFYCIIKAIQQLCGRKGRISVYGDDLIYPQDLHAFVSTVFTDLGFKLNLDKTYKTLPFRESCGFDFYRGVNVRPFSPEYLGGEVKNFLSFQAYLYKLINGLLRRWNDVEIPRTIYYLLRVLVNCGSEILSVPDDFPDDSGLKAHRLLRKWAFIPWEKPKWNKELQVMGFSYIRYTPCKRFIRSIRPYYWDALRRAVDGSNAGPYTDSTSNSLSYKYNKEKRKSMAVCTSKSDGSLSLGCFPSRKKRALQSCR